MLFNHFDLQKGQGHILQPNRSLNNFYVCLPHPSLGSSALFGSLKSRNYQKYFAIIVDECCDMPYRSPHLLCPASANIADSFWPPLRDCLSTALPKVMLPFQGSLHLMTDSRRNRKVWSSHFCTVQSLSHVQLFVTPWTAAHQASLSFTTLLEFAQIHVHWVSDAINQLILCCPFSYCLLSFPACESFQVSQLFT